jgi:O-antigen/teichoic acid export membrane protein
MILFRGEIARVLGSGQLADELALGSIAIAAGCLSAVAVGALNGMESFRMVALVTSVRSILSSMLMVAGAFWMGLVGAVGGWSIGESLAAGCSVYVVVRQRRVLGLSPSSRNARQGWSMLRTVGLSALVANAAVALALVIGQGVLAAQPSGFEEVAQFNVAYRWSLAVLFIPASIAPILLPLLTNLRAEGAVSTFLRLLRANMIVNSLLTALPAIVLIALRNVVLGLSGPAYAADSTTFVILMIASVPIAINTVMSNAALSLDAVRAWLISDLALAGALVGAAWLWVGVYGSSGLGLAYASGYAVSCVVLAVPLWNRVQQLRREG